MNRGGLRGTGENSSGTAKREAMTLKVVVEGEESEPPEYRLLRGQEGHLMQCR